MAEESQPPKRPRGNPAFQKKKTNNSTNTTQPMADKEEKAAEDTTEKKDITEDSPAQESGSTPPPTDKLPNDLFSDKIPDKETLPLDGEVKVKDYAALPNDTTGGGGGTTPPPADGSAKPAGEAPTAPTTGAAPPKPLTPEEINSQASQTVDMMFKGYEKLHRLGRYLGKIDENDLAVLHSEDKIDLTQELPVGKKTTSVGQFFQDYNQSIDENISVSEKFKTDMRPPLTRIAIKNNWLLNDEMFVGMYLADDLTTKVSMLVGLKKSANLVLKGCMDIKKAIKQQEAAKKKPASPPPPTEPAGETIDTDWREAESEAPPAQ